MRYCLRGVWDSAWRTGSAPVSTLLRCHFCHFREAFADNPKHAESPQVCNTHFLPQHSISFGEIF